MTHLSSVPPASLSLVEAMTQSILITTPELDLPGPYITYVNRAFEEMTGWTREEVLGKDPRILQGPKTDLSIFADLREKLSQGKVWRGQTINYRKDGTEFYMKWSIAPVYDSKGKLDQLLAVQQDVTEQVIIANRLKESRIREWERIEEIEKTNVRLNALAEKQEKILDLFVKYVPEVVVKEALAEGRGSIKEGRQVDIALLFCDIRKFTSMAENLSPAEVVRMLDTYYSKMAEVTKMHNGVINQFTGDEIFVTFGAPDPVKKPAIAATNCAYAMIRMLPEINDILGDILPGRLSVGIGLNYGPVIAGNLGSEHRLTYAITGDAVNTAKRIESLSSSLSNTILASDSIYQRLKNKVPTKPWGEVSVKGKEQKIKVYQLL